jgi:galactose oxidase-like protein/Big-like domain-containing protein
MTRLRRLNFAALAALLASISVQCGGDVGPPPDATSIQMAGGNGQAAQVGAPLPSPLTVLVTDDAGDPVSGVTVQWSVGGGGDVSPSSGATGSDGKASATRTLGATAGQQTTIAAVSGLQGSPVTFTATATEGGGGEGITITNNPPTSALTGEVFDPVAQPMVQVTDAGGQPATGVEVTASVASGGGTLEGTTTATTDASGVAKFGDLGITGTGTQTLEFTAGTSSVTSAPVNLSPLSPEATTGKWGSLVNWDIVPLHMHLLPNGKLLAWGKFEPGGTLMGMPRLWDPASGPPTTAIEVPVDTMLFCSGHAFMPDGRLLVSGGHKQDDKGIDVTNIFDWNSGSFVPGLPKMAFGRWYPTVTELTDGRMLTMAGRDSAGAVVTTPEIWENNQWVKLPGAGTLQIPYYPRNFIDPKNSLVFMAGERIMSRWFDPDGAGAGGARGRWINGPSHLWPFNRDYGTAAMYEPGKILVVGGGGNSGWATPDAKSSTPTATAEKIDLNAGTPTWQSAGSMSVRRRHLNSTILPDGQVLVTGGTSGAGFVSIDEALATKAAEEWNPSTNQWTTLAANSRMRVYHSVSILLPDATVLHGASGNAMAGAVPVPDENNHEIFSPPYLFKGVRPTITSAPTTVGYGQAFTVATPNAAQVTTVRWIHIGTVTHAFDFGQRANTLTFTSTATGVTVTAPSGPNLAPRGHYILFILNRNGVPSTGKVIQLQ